jgi:hypothetical protein
MPSNTYPRRASELSSLTYTIKEPADRAGSDSKSRKTPVHASEVDAVSFISTELTLDDFGGRSDALGG